MGTKELVLRNLDIVFWGDASQRMLQENHIVFITSQKVSASIECPRIWPVLELLEAEGKAPAGMWHKYICLGAR